MQESVFVRHEMRDVFNILDALQSRADNLIYSKESPSDDDKIEHSNEHLQRVFGCDRLSNVIVDKVLKEVQVNYVALAKDVLQVV